MGHPAGLGMRPGCHYRRVGRFTASAFASPGCGTRNPRKPGNHYCRYSEYLITCWATDEPVRYGIRVGREGFTPVARAVCRNARLAPASACSQPDIASLVLLKGYRTHD